MRSHVEPRKLRISFVLAGGLHFARGAERVNITVRLMAREPTAE